MGLLWRHVCCMLSKKKEKSRIEFYLVQAKNFKTMVNNLENSTNENVLAVTPIMRNSFSKTSFQI